MASREIVVQALPVLLLTAVGGALAGGVLVGMADALRALPALIVVAPALISLRGTINGAMGARLGSAGHMGLLDGGEGRAEVLENVVASLTLTAGISAAAAVFAWGATALLGLAPGDLVALVVVSVGAGLASGLVLAGLTVATVVLARRRGLDPDNVTSPILATVGDIVTLLFLLLFAGAWAALVGAGGAGGGGGLAGLSGLAGIAGLAGPAGLGGSAGAGVLEGLRGLGGVWP